MESETGGSSHLQQLSAERQQRLTAAIGQEAEEADAHEAMRKHMEQEAAQELLRRHGHQLLFAAVGVILPAERHLTIGEINEPMIGDGDAMGVAGQIMKNVLRAAERRLGVHDPVLAEERAKKRTECPFLAQAAEVCPERPTVFSERLSSAQP